jgi:hypothetical protein
VPGYKWGYSQASAFGALYTPFRDSDSAFITFNIAGFPGEIYLPHLYKKNQSLGVYFLKKSIFTYMKIGISTYPVAGSQLPVAGLKMEVRRLGS